MKTVSTKMMMVAGLALATLAGGAAHADARGFGHHGGFGHRGFGYGRFGYGGFGHHRYFHQRGYRRRFGGFNWGYPTGSYFLSSDFGDCRVVYNPLFFGHERVCS
jgi:hypothetical protein